MTSIKTPITELSSAKLELFVTERRKARLSDSSKKKRKKIKSKTELRRLAVQLGTTSEKVKEAMQKEGLL